MKDSVMIFLASCGNLDMVKHLIDGLTSAQKKFLLVMKSEDGKCTLMNFVKFNAMKFILDSLSPVDLLEVIHQKNGEGRTFLDVAIEEGEAEVITYLLDIQTVAQESMNKRGKFNKN